MRIAITGGTGFVGGHLARALTNAGHEVVLIARGFDRRNEGVRLLAGARFAPIGTSDENALTQAFAGCDGVAHCAGINREIGAQTYSRVHIQGTQNVVNAAKRAGVRKIVLLSFLRARPDCGSAYHESKWAAEEIVRSSGLRYTILKAGVIYGRGDHMLDHLSHALETFPVFALVGMKDTLIRPTAIEDLVRVIEAALIDRRLCRMTVAVTGPEETPLSEAVRRVANALGKHPVYVRLPVFLHYILAWILDRVMTIPLVSVAQVRILSEGIIEPAAPCERLPGDLLPLRSFSEHQIRHGLPEVARFGLKDCRWIA